MKIEHILQQERLDPTIEKKVILYKGEAYSYYDTGNTRYVFVNDSKTRVIKLLIDQNYKDFNLEEIEIYKYATEEKKKEMAETVMNYDGLVVEQEYCSPLKWDNRPMTIQQMLFAKSCRNEVGWDKDGNLKCFDLDEYKKW
jgi:hypothetical protein